MTTEYKVGASLGTEKSYITFLNLEDLTLLKVIISMLTTICNSKFSHSHFN